MNYDKEIDRLKTKAKRLKMARDGLTRFAVPIMFENGHNGDEVNSTQNVWALSEEDAVYSATHNDDGIAWCQVSGKVKILEHPPKFDRSFNEIKKKDTQKPGAKPKKKRLPARRNANGSVRPTRREERAYLKRRREYLIRNGSPLD